MTFGAKRGAVTAVVLAVTMVTITYSARASVITQTSDRTYVHSGEIITEQENAFGGDFLQFDPSLGTLNDVTVNFSASGTYNASFIVSPLCPELEAQGFTCNATFSFSTGYSFNGPGFPLTHVESLSDFFRLENFTGSVFVPDLAPQSSSWTFTNSANPSSVAGYIGTGDVAIVGGISEDSDACNADGVNCDLSTNVDVLTTLTYDYTPVPEPATLALFAGGLCGFALRRRKMAATVANC